MSLALRCAIALVLGIAVGAVVGACTVKSWMPEPGHRIMSIPEQVVSIAMEVGVPPALATQLASVESGMNPEAFHQDRNGTSWGVMQLSDRYWKQQHCYTNIMGTTAMRECPAEWNAAVNIYSGLTYLRTQLNRCHGNWACAVRRYRGLK